MSKQAEAHAQAMYQFKLKKLVFNCAVLTSTICLFLLKHFILPASLVTNPVVPLVFALLALSLSLANHYLGQYLDK